MKGTLARLLVDGFDFSTATAEVELNIEVPENDSTVLSSTAMEYQPTLAGGSIDCNGFFDGVADGIADALNDRLATAGVAVTVVFDIAGTPIAYTIPNSYGGSMVISAPTAGLITMNGSFGAGDGVKRAAVAAYGATATSTGAIGDCDNGSAGSSGGTAWIHVTSITGTATNATIDLESDSADDYSGAVSEGTFTFSDVGAYEISLSGVIGRYLRSNVTSLGGATAIEYTIIANVTGVS